MGAASRRFAIGGCVVVLVGMLYVWTPPWGAAAIGPKFGRSFVAARIGGNVLVTVPGGRAALLTHARRVPVGSTFDVTHGTARLTADQGNGRSYSGLFTKGIFQALQSTGSAATEIKLEGSLCTSASVARHHPHVHRQLQIVATPDFVVIGSNGYARAQSGVAKFSLTDTCPGATIAAGNRARDATTVVDQSGGVEIVAGRRPTVLERGQALSAFCTKNFRPNVESYCAFLETTSSGRTADAMGILNYNDPTRKAGANYELCLAEPTHPPRCARHLLSPAPEEVCFVTSSDQSQCHTAGPSTSKSAFFDCLIGTAGVYTAQWNVAGVPLADLSTVPLPSVPSARLNCRFFSPSILILRCPPTGQAGTPLTVAGALTPPVQDSPVTLDYTPPSGPAPVAHNVRTMRRVPTAIRTFHPAPGPTPPTRTSRASNAGTSVSPRTPIPARSKSAECSSVQPGLLRAAPTRPRARAAALSIGGGCHGGHRERTSCEGTEAATSTGIRLLV